MKPGRDGFGAAPEAGGSGDLVVHPLDDGRVPDFRAVHAHCGEGGWCQCVAWWVPSWAGWGDRSAAENRALRDDLFAHGEYDGYLLYADGAPVGWMQVGTVGRLEKLWNSYRLDELSVTPNDLAISCAFLLPKFRGRGHLHRFLELVLERIGADSKARVLAFPRTGAELPDDDVWTGPERAFLGQGFQVLRAHPTHPVLGWSSSRDAFVVRSEELAKNGGRTHAIVVFDLGGVLVDNAGIEQLLSWTPRLTRRELWARWLASPSVRAFECGESTAAEFAEALRTEFDLEPDTRAIEREIGAWIHGFYPGASELLSSLRPQVRLACLSNTNELHWSRMTREVDLYGLLDHRFLSFRCGLLKPDDGIYTHLLTQLSPWIDRAAERVLFLDDHPRNVDAAKAHGIDARRVVGLDAVRRELADAGFEVGPPPDISTP
ncbi:MAG: HAD family phosphatase [Candidatus Eisenbacteria bacterium]